MLLRIRWGSLRTRIVAWSFVPTTIILLAVALVTFYAYQKVTEDLVTGRNTDLTRLMAGQFAASLSEYTDVLQGLARTADIYRGEPAAQRAALQRASNRLVVFDGGVVMLDTHGKVTAAQPDRPAAIGLDWSTRSYYRQMLRSLRPAFSGAVEDGPQGASVIVLAVPVTGEQGELTSTMVGMFKLGETSVSSFYGGIVKLRTGQLGSTYLVDNTGRVIYHSDSSHIGEVIADQPVVQQVLGGRVGNLLTRDFDGQDVVATFAPVPGTPWGLVVNEQWQALMGSSQAYRQWLLLLLVLGLVVPVAFVVVGVRRITKPIEELTAAAYNVARGKFGQTITVRTGDELEELAQHFNLMSAQLSESYANLEGRVADRTKELATLNAIAAVVSSSLDLEEILNDALDKAMELTAMEGGAAFRVEDKGQTLALVAHRGLSDTVVRYISRLPLGAGASGAASSERQPVVMPVSAFSDRQLSELLTRDGFRSVVSVPLMAKGRTQGILNLTTSTVRAFSADELSLLAGVGHQIGVAVENAHLYEEAERSAAAAERNRLARDLHDAVSQTLFSASLIAEVLPRLWERNPEEARRRVAELRELTRGALAEMRTLLLELRPAALTEAALGDLLRQLAEAITGRARIPVTVVTDGQRSLPPDVQVALYRIAQEALNNVAKHAAACRAVVSLEYQAERVVLKVRDDGRGFSMGDVPPDHLGLGIMGERAEAISATLEVTSTPGGTLVEVVWSHGARKSAG